MESSFQKDRFTIKFNQDFTVLKGLPHSEVMKCSAPFSTIPEFISCIEEDYPWAPFLYNKKSKRFTWATLSAGAYVTQRGDTDSMYAGKCENF